MGSNSQREQNRKRAAKGAASGGDAAPFLRAAAKWKGWVNVKPDEDARGAFEEWCGDSDLVESFTTAALWRGYKLSVVQADDEDTYRANAYAAFAGMPDEGLSVGAWADSPLRAIASVVYIVGVMAGYDLTKFETEGKQSKRTF
jgi:hypothetical protein